MTRFIRSAALVPETILLAMSFPSEVAGRGTRGQKGDRKGHLVSRKFAVAALVDSSPEFAGPDGAVPGRAARPSHRAAVEPWTQGRGLKCL